MLQKGETMDAYNISPSSTARNEGKQHHIESTLIVYVQGAYKAIFQPFTPIF
jgi:hypothetical protein